MTSTQTISIIRKALIACGVIQESTELHQVQDHYATYIQRMYSDCSTNLPKTVHDLPEGELKVKALEILEETKNEVNVQTFMGTALTSPVAPKPTPEPEPQTEEPINESSPEPINETAPEPINETAPEPEPEPQTQEPQSTPSDSLVLGLDSTLEFLEDEDLEVLIRAGQEFTLESGAEIVASTVNVELNSFHAEIEITQTEPGVFSVAGLTVDHDGENLVAHITVGDLSVSHTFSLVFVG